MEDIAEETRAISMESPATPQSMMETAQNAVHLVNDVVWKEYLSKLSNMEIVPLSDEVLQSNLRDNVRLFKITEMVYEKGELATYKFASVLNSLANTEATVFLIMDSDGVKTDFYLGVRSTDEYRTVSSLKNTVKNALKGQFPGVKISDEYTIEDMEALLNQEKTQNVSSVSCVANPKGLEQMESQSFVQGLEKFVLSMQNEKYMGIIIANRASQQQIRELRNTYETIYSQLAPFASRSLNYIANRGVSYSEGSTDSSSHSETQTSSHSDSHSETVTTGSSITKTKAKGFSLNPSTTGGLASATSYTQGKTTTHSIGVNAGASASVDAGPFKGGVGAGISVGLSIARMVSKTLANTLSLGLGLASAFSTNTSSTDSESKSVGTGTSSSDSMGHSTANTVGHSRSKTEGRTQGIAEGMTLTLHDKSVEDVLERISKQLKRLDDFESTSMYGCAAYFLSEDPYAAEAAACTYKGLMCGKNSGVETAAINSWGQFQSEETKLVTQYVTNFMHPMFIYKGMAENGCVMPCSFVSANELALHMGLPRHSVCGLPVVEHADFAKEVVSYDQEKPVTGINLGSVFNMGSIGNNKVLLDLQSMAMHTFVTGSTGTGKSNTVYELLRQMDYFGVNFLVIEPAKGEYKNVFGMNPDVHVYGTNPQCTELLKINPFKFPGKIHVLEHIDRLVEIFNVCWPMYAAMPAVLKEAVLAAYRSCGWDLNTSENRYSKELFPTFKDLLRELETVISHSAYSEEVKGNYIGSLVTRVKSLTNGLNGQIFTSNEINNRYLFDKKAIVDISRIGSAETKSLIMGILIMRLNEYRMASSSKMNRPLQHVTVLEEAHNLLKRTTGQQNAEGTDVAGKSVEMISNAIAEMRTYGEGFIIADQSPNAVDISAIRNTNTKIIMRLPDEDDRRLAGKAAGLKDEQIDEIAKLPKGVAAVYQNNWLEPVLCKIEKFKGKEEPYFMPLMNFENNSFQQKKVLISNLLKKQNGDPLDHTIKELTDIIAGMDISTRAKIKALRALRTYGTCPVQMISPVIYDMICDRETEKEVKDADSIEEFKDILLSAQDSLLGSLDTWSQNEAIQCIIREMEKDHNSMAYLDIWGDFVKGSVV